MFPFAVWTPGSMSLRSRAGFHRPPPSSAAHTWSVSGKCGPGSMLDTEDPDRERAGGEEERGTTRGARVWLWLLGRPSFASCCARGLPILSTQINVAPALGPRPGSDAREMQSTDVRLSSTPSSGAGERPPVTALSSSGSSIHTGTAGQCWPAA